jgi:hydrogenase/urease accessory protein HupE
MLARLFIALTGAVSVLFSPLVFAHINKSPEGWMGVFLHPFTGVDHWMMLLILGIGIAYYIKKTRQSDK